jgi:hypothetical protein
MTNATAQFVVAAASHDEMECCSDYSVTIEAGFGTRAAAEAEADRLNTAEGHTWHFWVLTAEESRAV